MTPWTSSGDKMPEEGRRVLFISRGWLCSDSTVLPVRIELGQRLPVGGGVFAWYTPERSFTDGEVNYWMPLPELPESIVR